MNEKDIAALVIESKSELAALEEKVKSAHRRIDENDRITNGIHKLAINVEGLTLQVKALAEKMEESIERLEDGLKRQGERIGLLEKEPGQKWKDLAKQVISLVVAGVAGVILAKIF